MALRGWDDAFLDQMRQHGDPMADDAVREVHASGRPGAAMALLQTLVRNDAPPPEALPPELKTYLAETAAIPAPLLPHLKQGEDVFAEHGPEIFMLLGCYSLPAAYGARKGVQVLARTGQLSHQTQHRLFLTSQMVLDVMTPGGMNDGGRGIRTAQKVRLLHATVRQVLLNDDKQPWDPSLGVPINQEDLAGTLMTFSYHVMHGLEMLGIPIEPEEQEAYCETWRGIAKVMGLVDEMVPHSMAEAQVLTETIERRQIAASPQGRDLTQALLAMMSGELPRGLRGIPAALMRRLLPPNVSDFLGVPNPFLSQALVSALVFALAAIDRFDHRSARRLKLFRFITVQFMQFMISKDLGGRASFMLPASLHGLWGVPPAGETRP